jgi:hypothetical protein
VKKGMRTIEDPATCCVRGCWTVIERRWRICGRCWHKLPAAVRGVLASLREWCGQTPVKHPQDEAKTNTPHHLYALVWREAMNFLSEGVAGSTLPWRVAPGSSFEHGPFHRHHDEAKESHR